MIDDDDIETILDDLDTWVTMGDREREALEAWRRSDAGYEALESDGARRVYLAIEWAVIDRRFDVTLEAMRHSDEASVECASREEAIDKAAAWLGIARQTVALVVDVLAMFGVEIQGGNDDADT